MILFRFIYKEKSRMCELQWPIESAKRLVNSTRVMTSQDANYIGQNTGKCAPNCPYILAWFNKDVRSISKWTEICRYNMLCAYAHEGISRKKQTAWGAVGYTYYIHHVFEFQQVITINTDFVFLHENITKSIFLIKLTIL